MIVVLNGTLGVGKTWISRWLMSQLDDAAVIESDPLGFVSPSLLEGLTRQQFALQVAVDLIEIYRRRNAKTIVFDFCFLDPEVLKEFLRAVGGPSRVFYLSAPAGTVASRIKTRARPHFEKELQEAREVELRQRRLFSAEELGHEIQTGGKTPEQIVEEIKSLISSV